MSATDHSEFLRDAYADAGRNLAKSKAEFQAFERELESFGIPKWEWRRQVLRCFIDLKRYWDRDLKILLRIGRELKAFEAPAVAKTETRPAAKPSKFYSATYDQNIEVKIVDGKTVSRFDHDGAHWIKVDAWHMAGRFRRHYRFFGKQVPSEYAFVLQHNGNRYAPTDSVYIEYEVEEFKRICQREVETQSAHGLDGERLDYWRRHDRQAIGRVDDEQKGSDGDDEEK